MKKIQLMIRPALASSMLFVTLVLTNGKTAAVDSQSDAKFETRCGWLAYLRPGNVWLDDRDDEWIIDRRGDQGGDLVGDWHFPKFKAGQWVQTIGDYGYGCACFELRVNKETKEVTDIKSSRARPLSACRNDPALKKWKKQYK